MEFCYALRKYPVSRKFLYDRINCFRGRQESIEEKPCSGLPHTAAFKYERASAPEAYSIFTPENACQKRFSNSLNDANNFGMGYYRDIVSHHLRIF